MTQEAITRRTSFGPSLCDYQKCFFQFKDTMVIHRSVDVFVCTKTLTKNPRIFLVVVCQGDQGNFHHTSTQMPAKKQRGASLTPSKDAADSSSHVAAVSPPSTSSPHVCPLCLSLSIEDPVVIHVSEREGDTRVFVCLACRVCASEWSQLSTYKHHGDARGDDTSTTCPLCTELCSIIAASDLRAISEHERCLAPPPHGKKASIAPIVCIQNVATGCCDTAEELRGDASNSSSLCGACEEREAPQECVNCGFPLCDECKDATHKKGRFKDHTLRPIGASSVSPRKDSRNKDARMCPQHPNDVINLYCVTCEEPACVTCCFDGAHKDHKAERLVNKVSEGKTDARHELNALVDLSERAGQSVNALGDALPIVETKQTTVQANIKTFFDELRAAVNTRESELLQELDVYLSDKRAAIDDKRRVLETTQHQVSRLTSTVANMIECAHEVDFMTVRGAIRPRVESLKQQLASACMSREDATAEILVPLQQVEFRPGSSVAGLCNGLHCVGDLHLPVQSHLATVAHHTTGDPQESRSGAPKGDVPPRQQQQQQPAGSYRKDPSPYGESSPAAHSRAPVSFKLSMPSLNISTQLPSGDPAGKSRMQSAPPPTIAPVLPAVSRNKRFLNIADEAGEPARKSASRTTTATLSSGETLFAPVARQAPPAPPQASGADGAAAKTNPVGLLGHYQLKL